MSHIVMIKTKIHDLAGPGSSSISFLKLYCYSSISHSFQGTDRVILSFQSYNHLDGNIPVFRARESSQ
jgi:hypothetical protein